MEIRKAIESDRKEIAFVFADAFSNDWKLLSNDTEKVMRGLQNGLTLDQTYVAVCEGKVVAFLALVVDEKRAFQIPLKDFQKEFGFFKGYMAGMALKNDMERVIPLEEGTAYIDIVGVCKAYQHKGIASQLIDYVIAHTSFDTYLLTVTDINEHARACYEKLGFKEVRREKVKYAKQKGFSEYLYLQYEKVV